MECAPLNFESLLSYFLIPPFLEWECLSCTCYTFVFWAQVTRLISQVHGDSSLPQDESYLEYDLDLVRTPSALDNV